MSAHTFTTDPTTHTIHVPVSAIDTAALITLASELDATECPGALRDDNQNEGVGLRPRWTFRLELPGGATFRAVVVRLMDLSGGRRTDEFSVVVSPEAERETTLPAFDRSFDTLVQHMGSQLADCNFRVGIQDSAREAWALCRHFDSSLLRCLLRPRSRDEIMRFAEDQCLAFADRYDAADLSAMIKAEQERRLACWIDPTYRVHFVMRGHVFYVDRSGPELVLVPTQGVDPLLTTNT